MPIQESDFNLQLYYHMNERDNPGLFEKRLFMTWIFNTGSGWKSSGDTVGNRVQACKQQDKGLI
jgi:hypothetical protein